MKWLSSQRSNRVNNNAPPNQLQIFSAETWINCTPWSAAIASWVVFSTIPPKYARYWTSHMTVGTTWGSLSSSGGVRQRCSLSLSALAIFVHLWRYLFRQGRECILLGKASYPPLLKRRIDNSQICSHKREGLHVEPDNTSVHRCSVVRVVRV